MKKIKFIMFLLLNGAYRKYNRNCFAPMKEILNISKKGNFISGAFTWSETPEGFKYWAELNDKYLKSWK